RLTCSDLTGMSSAASTVALPVSTSTTARVNGTIDSGSYPAFSTRVFISRPSSSSLSGRNRLPRPQGTQKAPCSWARRLGREHGDTYVLRTRDWSGYSIYSTMPHLLSSRLSGSGPTARCAWNSTFSRITPQAPVTQFIRPATRRLRFPFTPTGRERTCRATPEAPFAIEVGLTYA